MDHNPLYFQFEKYYINKTKIRYKEEILSLKENLLKKESVFKIDKVNFYEKGFSNGEKLVYLSLKIEPQLICIQNPYQANVISFNMLEKNNESSLVKFLLREEKKEDLLITKKYYLVALIKCLSAKDLSIKDFTIGIEMSFKETLSVDQNNNQLIKLSLSSFDQIYLPTFKLKSG